MQYLYPVKRLSNRSRTEGNKDSPATFPSEGHRDETWTESFQTQKQNRQNSEVSV